MFISFLAATALATTAVPSPASEPSKIVQEYEPCRGDMYKFRLELEEEWQKYLLAVYLTEEKTSPEKFKELLKYHADFVRNSESWRSIEESLCKKKKRKD